MKILGAGSLCTLILLWFMAKFCTPDLSKEYHDELIIGKDTIIFNKPVSMDFSKCHFRIIGHNDTTNKVFYTTIFLPPQK